MIKLLGVYSVAEQNLEFFQTVSIGSNNWVRKLIFLAVNSPSLDLSRIKFSY